MPRPLNEWRLASKETYRSFCTKFPQYKISFEVYKKITLNIAAQTVGLLILALTIHL